MEDHSSHDPSQELPDRSADALRELEARARAALAGQRDSMSQLERQLVEQIDVLSAALAEQTELQSAAAASAEEARLEAQRLREETDQAQAEWQQDREAMEQAVAKRRAELDDEIEELSDRTRQLEQLGGELEEFRATMNDRAAQLDAREQEIADREREVLARAQSEENNTQLARQKAAWEKQRAALESERDEIQNKFELAIQDVQRLRGRVTELEEDLSRRPETDEGDSDEIAHLRGERDALAERIEHLERELEEQVDADAQQRLSDLQRRFELAVEDVRELKTRNAKLEEQLAQSSHRSGQSDDGGMDWESQKRRLLASLADEGENVDATREKERATIEGTIRITDEVVEQKDRELAELRARVADQGGDDYGDPAAAERDAQINELLDADEVIQQHRKKLEQMRQDLEEKLRAAEVELSVERAKIARKQVELNEWRTDLEAQKRLCEADGKDSPGGVPQRRWLAKLGLGGDEQEG